MRMAPAMAVPRPPTETTPPAAMPHAINARVTAFGDQPSRAKTHVACGEIRRMYSRPAQRSSLSLSITDDGCPLAFSSASDGPDIVPYPLARFGLGQAEALQDRVPAGPRARRADHRLGELSRRQTQVGRGPGQPVPGQARGDQFLLRRIAAQGRAEQGADPGQLT